MHATSQLCYNYSQAGYLLTRQVNLSRVKNALWESERMVALNRGGSFRQCDCII